VWECIGRKKKKHNYMTTIVIVGASMVAALHNLGVGRNPACPESDHSGRTT